MLEYLAYTPSSYRTTRTMAVPHRDYNNVHGATAVPPPKSAPNNTTLIATWLLLSNCSRHVLTATNRTAN